MLHPTEKYYPLRPELAESTFYLYQATKGMKVWNYLFASCVIILFASFFNSCFLIIVKWGEFINFQLVWSIPIHLYFLTFLFSLSYFKKIFYCFLVLSDPWYIEVGKSIVDSLNIYTKVEGGFASIRDVTTMELEDHQHSFFLAET